MITRPIIIQVKPEIDGGKFPVKKIINDYIDVSAVIICDGMDELSCNIRFKHQDDPQWRGRVPLNPSYNDKWIGKFQVKKLGIYYYTIEAYVDDFLSLKNSIYKKLEANVSIDTEILETFNFIEICIEQIKIRINNVNKDKKIIHQNNSKKQKKAIYYQEKTQILKKLKQDLYQIKSNQQEFANILFKEQHTSLIREWLSLTKNKAFYNKKLTIQVEQPKALFSSWYEFFPRSLANTENIENTENIKNLKHGNFKTCIKRLPYIKEMGFDIIYFPPIHPIGFSFRKGANNSLEAKKDEPGCPWAIGNKSGGHKAIHPELGTLNDFKELINQAKKLDIDIAIDIAFQCSPDHPYVKDHPDWFKIRPDGTIKFAENPPKKYQDIYPLNFECEDWKNLWLELKSIIEFWIKQGIKIFRVDNPHTKSFNFWQWLINEIKKNNPEIIFLSEAFTKSEIMYYLAKIGFTQSYTYFTWKNSKHEIIEYLNELMRSPIKDFFRPGFWPNTPDILNEYLQKGGRNAHIIRLILAATTSATYGIYGPVFELCENIPLKPNSEEYLNSEKYQIRKWDLNNSILTIKPIITKINQIRKENPALQKNNNFHIHHTENDNILCYSKSDEKNDNVIITILNIDPYNTQNSWVYLNLNILGLQNDKTFEIVDLLNNKSFYWKNSQNFVELNPNIMPAHIFQLKRTTKRIKSLDNL